MNTIRRVKIIGAGSIGNHLAQACRRHSWDVTVVDLDPAALRRMREEIYPSRYGVWDDEIKLVTATDEPHGGFDVIFVGTPPDVRLDVAMRALDENPRVLQLEKPLCGQTDEAIRRLSYLLSRWRALGEKTMIVVGYDHILNEITEHVDGLIRSSKQVKTIDVDWREHWQGIFAAHPWLSGPASSYLGYWKRGGGASGEHSHALNLWQHLAHVAGWGKVRQVQASMQMVSDESGLDYDEQCILTLHTECGHVGRVVQDVITKPMIKRAMIVTDKTRIEWRYGWEPDADRVTVGEGEADFIAPRKRPDDFYREILHIDALLDGRSAYADSPIGLMRGIETMCVLRAAHISHGYGSGVNVLYHL